jgi:SAM-dependent methyltransferase
VIEDVTQPPKSIREMERRGLGLTLFLTGFLVLFLELACIRWFAANVIFLQFFTNVVLLAAFLGMSCGCMAARAERDWLALFPTISLLTVSMAVALLVVYSRWAGLAVDVGHQASPQEIFFGTEYRDPDVAQFTLPIDLIVAVFFVLIALMFVGLGQVLGKAFDAYPDRIMGYTLNIGGSLAGIVVFSVLSALETVPVVWFLIACIGVAYLLRQDGRLSWTNGLTLFALLVCVASPGFRGWKSGAETVWSPYYAVQYTPNDRAITVNNIGHQQIVPFRQGGASYSLIHLLQTSAGGSPFQDVLIIGAGSGNDIDRALHHGVRRIDAVEIDPAIRKLGVNKNPDQPYADPRVIPHIDDGRHFLRTTDRKYDLVVYALVDSLILHSSYANLRLESYLFTREALADVKRVLKPGGIFVTYNYFRQGWVVERVAAMSEAVFGCKPIVLSLPYRSVLPSSARAGFTVVVSGCNSKIADAFSHHDTFWLHVTPSRNLGINGFSINPQLLPPGEREAWQQIAPTSILHDSGAPQFATDDWPFLYLQSKLIPDLSVRSMIVLGSLGIAMVWLFLPKTAGFGRIDGRLFFLGAAFMLLETKAVVQLALLFGSTWLVNSLVFFTALILVLIANLFVLRFPGTRLTVHYAALFVLLLAAIAVPIDVFLTGGLLWRYAAPSALALGPMFFAGVIFARSFRETRNPDWAFGSNIAGSVVGGLSESFSMLLGFRYILLLALGFYLLSIIARPRAALAAT